jgi:hypothetical protein
VFHVRDGRLRSVGTGGGSGTPRAASDGTTGTRPVDDHGSAGTGRDGGGPGGTGGSAGGDIMDDPPAGPRPPPAHHGRAGPCPVGPTFPDLSPAPSPGGIRPGAAWSGVGRSIGIPPVGTRDDPLVGGTGQGRESTTRRWGPDPDSAPGRPGDIPYPASGSGPGAPLGGCVAPSLDRPAPTMSAQEESSSSISESAERRGRRAASEYGSGND